MPDIRSSLRRSGPPGADATRRERRSTCAAASAEAAPAGAKRIRARLPGIDGIELTRRLKADPTICDIPIVAVSAYAMKGDDRKALDAGCVAYATKPIDTRKPGP
ncbi:MAG: response regulator [Candidatus Xenobia bacterium]